MTLEITHWNVDADGELSETALRCKLESLGYTVSRYLYPPGTRFPAHSHAQDKIDAVLCGRFRMSVQGESIVLQAGDTLAVPRGELHSAEVIGSEPVVSLDAIRD